MLGVIETAKSISAHLSGVILLFAGEKTASRYDPVGCVPVAKERHNTVTTCVIPNINCRGNRDKNCFTRGHWIFEEIPE